MPSWWGKPSKGTKKESNRESIIGSLHRKCIRPGTPRRRRSDSASDKESQIRADFQSPSPSKSVARCQSLGEKTQPQPLPLPAIHFGTIAQNNSRSSKPTKQALNKSFKTSMLLPVPKPKFGKIKNYSVDGENDLAYGTDTSDSFSDTEDPSDSRLLSPQASDYENGAKSVISSPSGVKQRDQPPSTYKRNSKERSKPANSISLTNQTGRASPRQRHLSSNITLLQIPQPGFALSAPESSMSSPNSTTGDGPGQLLWQQSRCSPEWSPLPSPRMTSPGPSSRIQSGAVTPLHPRAGGPPLESQTGWADDGKQQSHPLPLPPTTISNPSLFTTSYSTGTSPRIPRSPGRTDNVPSPGPRWKKGRLLGRGTFGHVYLGFNSDTGEMCAMKEVTLFADDAKSRESAQQLGQEIALLSRLRHPNIVQYYGSETVDDKLYIYLEYVSGGSIYKILQEYGQLGEAAIRSYTQQILSGLAYLHAKHTVHRDVKGANILVDPTGWVKLADFGMAKHMTGASGPLSFKGSPYWMAPEVIKNSSGCNLAVDIWSLGCTVLEMATTKPPWSQYEGVAALFKIGNGKELPLIPEYLSEEGKDFVMKCLKRDPRDRPSAAQLLEHPFVKSSAALERPILSAEPVEGLCSVTHGVKMLGFGPSGTSQSVESPGSTSRSKSPIPASGYSDAYMSRNKSFPVSPVSSPLLHAPSPQHMKNHSPISSPRAASGASTPLSGHNNGGTPFYHQMPTKNYLPEGLLMIPRPQNTIPRNANTYHPDQKSDIFRGIVCAHLSQDSAPREAGISGQKIEQPKFGQQKDSSYEAHFVLADRVSQQLLRNPVRLDPVLDLKLNSPAPDRNSQS